jgi:hypothetical protein
MLVVVKEVHTKADVERFHHFTRELYKTDAAFISHLDKDIEAIFNPKLNTELEMGQAKRWLALTDNKVIGKIAAFFNHKQSGIGFFDCINDQRTANLLFDTATNWLKNNGIDRVEAPVNFGERDKYWGLLVEGFSRPSYQENYNFPYYEALFENYGFEKAFEQTTSEVSIENATLNKILAIDKRLKKSSDFSVEHFKSSNKEKYLRAFVQIYNAAWKQHEFFEPMTYQRVEALFKSMQPILREDLLWFTFKNNEPVAFYLSVIDVNQVFRHLNGKLNWWGKLKFLWYNKFEKIDRFRGIIFGVIPKYQNKGVYSGMVAKVYEVALNDPYLKSTELAWIGDFNPKMHALFKVINAQKTKVHFTYEKQL